MSAPPATPDGNLRANVLAWMSSTGRGYKAAAAEFGVPRSTIQSWAVAERQGVPKTPRARAPAPAREASPEATEAEPWDPSTCTRDEWLRRQMVFAMERTRVEIEAKHGGTAARWEAISYRYRDELDEWNEAQRLAGLAPAPVDLVVMSRELAELLPALVRMDPARWASAVDKVAVEVAKYRGTLTTRESS